VAPPARRWSARGTDAGRAGGKVQRLRGVNRCTIVSGCLRGRPGGVTAPPAA
jgi:hypothetical protein